LAQTQNQTNINQVELCQICGTLCMYFEQLLFCNNFQSFLLEKLHQSRLANAIAQKLQHSKILVNAVV